MSIPPEVQREYLLEGYDFSGLGQIKTETLNLPIRAIWRNAEPRAINFRRS